MRGVQWRCASASGGSHFEGALNALRQCTSALEYQCTWGGTGVAGEGTKRAAGGCSARESAAEARDAIVLRAMRGCKRVRRRMREICQEGEGKGEGRGGGHERREMTDRYTPDADIHSVAQRKNFL